MISWWIIYQICIYMTSIMCTPLPINFKSGSNRTGPNSPWIIMVVYVKGRYYPVYYIVLGVLQSWYLDSFKSCLLTFWVVASVSLIETSAQFTRKIMGRNELMNVKLRTHMVRTFILALTPAFFASFRKSAYFKDCKSIISPLMCNNTNLSMV